MYSLTQNFNTLAEMQAFVAAMGAVPNGQAGGKAAKPAAASPSPSTAAPSPAAPAAPKVVKYEDSGIAEMLKTSSEPENKANGKYQKAVDLLKEMGAVVEGKVSGKHLKPEQYVDFKAKLQAIIDTKVEESIE